jgi:hypothetical protein
MRFFETGTSNITLDFDFDHMICTLHDFYPVRGELSIAMFDEGASDDDSGLGLSAGDFD